MILATCHCGYSKRSKTRPLAEYGLRLHSCERHRQLTERRARGAAIRARQDANRTPKPCPHNNTQHAHGTHACYVLDRCRCRPCTDAHTVYERRRTRNNAYGRPPYVDAEPARRHVRQLQTDGLGLKRIAALTGVAHGGLAKLIYGDAQRGLAPSKRIRPTTEAKILAVTANVGTLSNGAFVDATGTHRRVQALVWLGWSQNLICQRVGVQRSNFGSMMRRQQVTAATARGVAAVYADLHNQPPPERTWHERSAATRARNHARANGWKPPMWWAEDIDEPDVLASGLPCVFPQDVQEASDEGDVDWVAVDRFVNGDNTIRLTRDERWAVYQRLRAIGVTHNQAAIRLKMSGGYSKVYLDRYDAEAVSA